MKDRQPQTALYVGIDVSKPTLTIALYPTAQVWDILAGARSAAAEAACSAGAAGEFGRLRARRGTVPVMVVPAQRARHFAKSMRGDLKTDRVDAQLLAYFACCYPAPEATAMPEGQAQLRALWARREQLVQMLEAEKKRRQGAPETVRASLERLIAVLEEEIAQIEAEVAALIEADASLSQKAALLQTAVGVGAVVAYGLLAELPELGQVSREAIAALAGLAPVRRESGRWRGSARIGGGRWRVRRLLYLAAVVAVSHDARWRFPLRMRWCVMGGVMSVCRGARDLTFQYPCSYRFPPQAGGTKQRFPLRSRGNLTEGVFKKCRAMSAKRGEPHGGGQ
jgi:transposase